MTGRGASASIPRMATRQVSVTKGVSSNATITASAIGTYPVTVTTATAKNRFHTFEGGPTYTWQVAPGVYTTATTLAAAFTGASPVGTAPPARTRMYFTADATTRIIVHIVKPAGNTGMYLVGTAGTNGVVAQAKLNTVAATGGVGGAAVRLWQTTSTVSPDPTVTKTPGIFQAGTPSDPVPITIKNLSGTNDVWIAQGGEAAPTVTKTTGERLGHGASKAYSVRGNDQVYAVATTATATVSVSVGRQ